MGYLGNNTFTQVYLPATRARSFPKPANVESHIRSSQCPRAALRAQARRTAVFLIKDRARAYARRPMTLETISPGLAAAAPDTMVAVAKHLIETARQAPRRWFGFGGEVPILNAKAVLQSAC